MSSSRSLTIVAVIALLWNLMGIAAFFMQYTADLDALAKVDPYQAKAFSEMPGWQWAAYAVAVFSGLAGTIFLFLRSKHAIALYTLSLAAVIVQFGYTFLATDIVAVMGWGKAAGFPLFIFIAAVAQLLYARTAAARGALR